MGKIGLFIWSILLAVPGAVGLWAVCANQKMHDLEVVRYRPQVQQQTQRYLDNYRKWNELPAAQRAENPWGQGEYGGPAIQNEMKENQDKRLLVDIDEMSQGNRAIPDELAQVLYGSGWEQKVYEYKRSREMREIVLILSGISLSAGVLTLLGTTAFSMVKLLTHRKAHTEQKENTSKKTASAKQPETVVVESAEQSDPEPNAEETTEPELTTGNKKFKDQGYFESIRSARVTAGLSTHSSVSSMQAQTTAVAEDSAEATLMSPQPVLNSLNELTEEVSAIRQFAAQQQDQMKKLQDGYDWMLIRRFCLRIIRCIDNLCDRIEKSRAAESDTHMLEEIRDELIYALESSGVEQFEPDVGIEYKGLERYAEAIRDRESSGLPEQSGKIAKIVRPGYQYLVSDSDVKIVRCAQVRLYE